MCVATDSHLLDERTQRILQCHTNRNTHTSEWRAHGFRECTAVDELIVLDMALTECISEPVCRGLGFELDHHVTVW
jgi:hypothetical protein